MVTFSKSMSIFEGVHRLRAPLAVHFPKLIASEKRLKSDKAPKEMDQVFWARCFSAFRFF